MIQKKKLLASEQMPEFQEAIDTMPADSRIFVDKSLEIADYIFQLMEEKGLKQKDLADRMGKTEAEVSKILGGMHNLTLRSIAKLEAALGAPVICTPKTEISMTMDTNYGSLKDIKSNIIKKELPELNYGAKIIRMKSENYRKEKSGAV